MSVHRKPELEFTNTELMGEWTELPSGFGKMWEKVLSKDEASGGRTRLVRFEPGLETDEILRHDYWEEVYILEGSMRDKRKNITMGRGYYACRPIGMEHGPYSVPFGCTMLEISYP